MSYIISEDGKELLKDVRDFCVNEVKEQVKEYDQEPTALEPWDPMGSLA